MQEMEIILATTPKDRAKTFEDFTRKNMLRDIHSSKPK